MYGYFYWAKEIVKFFEYEAKNVRKKDRNNSGETTSVGCEGLVKEKLNILTLKERKKKVILSNDYTYIHTHTHIY